MPKLLLRTPAGDTPINVQPPGDFESFYLFAMHKSGSTLLNRMMDIALQKANIPQIAMPDVAFAAGLPDDDISNAGDLIFEYGYCYRGFRIFPGYLREFDLSKKKKVLLVRDPRDMIVSYYFSIAHSHPIPTGPIRDEMIAHRTRARKNGIDIFCCDHAESFKDEFLSYERLLYTDVRIYRYEDVIFKKAEWLEDMLGYFGITLDKAEIRRIAAENDVRPNGERPHEHIRQVNPGNFRKHLGGATIQRLNGEFEHILKQYGYNDCDAQPMAALSCQIQFLKSC